MTGGGAQPGPWDQLALVDAPNRGEFKVLPAAVATSMGGILFALDADGRRHLLVPVHAGAPFPPDRRSAGVHVSPRELETETGLCTFIDIGCRRPHLNEVFSHLADEVLAELKDDPSNPYITCRKVLARWRELIDREIRDVLSLEAQAGLFGELWHLRELVRRNPNALSSWTGPLRQPHDFMSGTTSLEVKTTLSRDLWMFQIHGIDQLEAPSGGALFMAAMRLEHGGSAGESLPEVIDSILSLGPEPTELLRRLLDAGYDTRDMDYYRQHRFRVSEQRVYVIDGAFPRIVRATLVNGVLPNRISRLAYTIDLAGHAPAPVQEPRIEQMYDLLVGIPA